MIAVVLDTMWGYAGKAPRWFKINPCNHSGKRLIKLISHDRFLVTNICKEQTDSANKLGKPDVAWLSENLAKHNWELVLVCGTRPKQLLADTAMQISHILGIPWRNVVKAIKPAHKYTQRQLDTLAVSRPALYAQHSAEGIQIVPEPVQQAPAPKESLVTGLSTSNPKSPKSPKAATVAAPSVVPSMKAKKIMSEETGTTSVAEAINAPLEGKKNVKKPVKKAAKKVVKKVVKKVAVKGAKPAKKAEKVAKAPGQSGIERDHDLPWNEKKVAVFKALKACKATEAGNAVSAQTVVDKDGTLTTRDVRHYCYHAKAAGLCNVAEVEGIRGYGFYLTAKGLKVDLKEVLKGE